MRVERFKAHTMREAMSAIKAKLGEDAAILHTRTVNNKIEIIAAIDEPQRKFNSLFAVHEKAEPVPAPEPAIKRVQPIPAVSMKTAKVARPVAEIPVDRSELNSLKLREAIMEKKNNGHHDAITGWEELIKLASDHNGNGNGHSRRPLNGTPGLAPESRPITSDPVRETIAQLEEQRRMWRLSEEKLDTLQKEIAELKEILLRRELASLKEDSSVLPVQQDEKPAKKSGPVDELSKKFFQNIKNRLKERGLTELHTELIVTKLKNQAFMQHLNLGSQIDVKRLRELLAYEVRKFIKVSSIEKNDNSRRIVAFVGPDGAGKTTSCLKIALTNMLYRDKKVALVLVNKSEKKTAQHLSQLAGAARLPLTLVNSAPELKTMINTYRDRDLILIDFALEQEENDGFEELCGFLKSAQPTETHLVLPATFNREQITSSAKQFQATEFQHVIFSHIDDMERMGAIIELSNLVGKPISYIGNGPKIPEDIEIANATKLTYMVLKG